jgi:homogentisate 1,2-dioxygenase
VACIFFKPFVGGLLAKNAQTKAYVKHVENKRLGEFTYFEYESNYYDTVGWKGDLYPYTLHVDDIMPLMSHRAHLPPSAHTTFVAREFVICTFLPRPLEKDKDALKVPFYHQNIDYDEVLFYHDGNFFSRDNLHAGMMSLHPMGFPHGPHPKAMKTVESKTETDEIAVMVDSRWPLIVDPALEGVELKEYWKSWRG